MNLGCPDSGWRRSAAGLAAALALLATPAAAPIAAHAQGTTADPGWRDATVAQYQQHLADLSAIVAACQKQRSAASATLKSFSACDPVQVGPDDRVHVAGADSQPREVRYDWLRGVLTRAITKDGAQQKSLFGDVTHPNAKPVSVDSLLDDASRRLRDDAAQVGTPPTAAANFADERKSLNSILSQRAYQGVTQVSAMDRAREWFDNLLDRFFSGLVRFGSRAPWIVWLLRILLVLGACTALVWLVVRIERRARVKLVPDLEIGPGAPSAREWQLWLRDAQEMAARGEWRDAIHFIYWASIARLESKHVWPADRARTPREYLALVAGSDPRKSNLTALTRNFERTWYGGRAAQASDFNAAREQAAALGVAAE
jgi:hypothetical protein